MATPEALSASALAIGQTVVAYQFFLPKLSEVRRADPGEAGMRGDVRLGQVAAGSVSIGVAAIVASLTGSTLPLYVSLIVAGIIAGVYQYAMVGERESDGNATA